MATSVQDAGTLISEIIPSDEVEKLEIGRTEEILQPLIDLAYLKEADVSKMAKGILLFRRDYLSLNLIPEFTPDFLNLSQTDLEGEELSLLHTLTALDGDFTIDTMPPIGEVTLLSRVAHYRLHIHQLFHSNHDAPFAKESLDGLKKLRSWIQNLPPSDLELINKLGDIPSFIQFINVDINGLLNKKIVVFKYKKETRVSAFQVTVPQDEFDEVSEDVDDKEIENEAEIQKLESSVDKEIDAFSKKNVFDSEEQKALQKSSKKDKRRRSRLDSLDEMIDIILKKQAALSKEIGDRSDEITVPLNRLKKLKITLSNEEQKLAKHIERNNKSIKDLSNSKKRLKKKERILKRKKRKGRPAEEIQKLELEIKNIKSADKKIEQLHIENSPLIGQKNILVEELKNIDRKVKSLQKN